MIPFICATCGAQYPPTATPPPRCVICEDERQYVASEGPCWTTTEDMVRDGLRNSYQLEEAGLTSLRTVPTFAIGQRAFVVQTPMGNVLWDCLSHLDEDTIRTVRELGGLRAIAVSHPHFYGTCVEWSAAFGEAPIFLHEADRAWVTRDGPSIVHWSGESVEPIPGLTLVRLGGHFEGSAVLHWPAGANGAGALLTGDTIQVVPDRRFVGFMYSYPNYIPLPPAKVQDIWRRISALRFSRVYGAFGNGPVLDAPAAIGRSVQRYLDRLNLNVDDA